MAKRLTEEETIKWLDKIKLGLAWRKPYEKTWLRYINYLRSKYLSAESDDDEICINMVFPHVRVVIPAIYSRNPDISIRPRRKDSLNDDLMIKRCEVKRDLARYHIEELDLKTEGKLCVLDGVIIGHAWMKSGYESVIEKEDTLVSEIMVEQGLKEPPKDKMALVQTNYKILSESPWSLRTSPFDMIVPALSRRPEELRWISERIVQPYEYVMDCGKFKKKRLRDLKPTTNGKELLKQLRGEFYKDLDIGEDEEYVVMYETYDQKTGCIYTFAEDHPIPLEEKDSQYKMLDSKFHPYRMLRFNEVTDQFYPMSDIEAAEAQLLELNVLRSDQKRHIKRYNRKYLSRPSALLPDDATKLKEGEDGSIIEVTNTYADDDLNSVIVPLQDANMPGEAHKAQDQVKNDIFTILGTMDYTGPGGQRSATEASIIATQSRYRVEERIDIINMFIQNVIKDICQISEYFMDAKQVAEIIGVDSVYWIQKSDPEEIRREFSHKVIYGSTAPINREVEKAQFVEFFDRAFNNPLIDQVKLHLELVRKYDLPYPETWIVDEIAQELERQRLIELKTGMLMGNGREGSENASGTRQGVPRLRALAGGEKLPTGQPRGIGAARRVGGVGGSNPDRY